MNLSKRTRAIILILTYFLVQYIISSQLLSVMNLNTLSVVSSALLLVVALLLYVDFLKEEYQHFINSFEG